MLTTATRTKSSYEARMLAAADRLFAEFDDLPVATVFRAISTSRRALREQHGMAVPEAVEDTARRQLVDARRTHPSVLG